VLSWQQLVRSQAGIDLAKVTGKDLHQIVSVQSFDNRELPQVQQPHDSPQPHHENSTDV